MTKRSQTSTAYMNLRYKCLPAETIKKREWACLWDRNDQEYRHRKMAEPPGRKAFTTDGSRSLPSLHRCRAWYAANKKYKSTRCIRHHACLYFWTSGLFPEIRTPVCAMLHNAEQRLSNKAALYEHIDLLSFCLTQLLPTPLWQRISFGK